MVPYLSILGNSIEPPLLLVGGGQEKYIGSYFVLDNVESVAEKENLIFE